MNKKLLVGTVVFFSLIVSSLTASIFAQEEAAPVVPAVAETKPEAVEVAVGQEAKVIFGFEKNIEGWEIPDWCFEKDDYVGNKLSKSEQYASEGKSSLEINVNFPGGIWTAAYVEIMQYFDWTGQDAVCVDVFIPKDAPNGLKAKMIATSGEDWKWTEMTRSEKLIPGEWVTIEANLTDDSTAWKGVACDDDFRSDIRKLGVRIESNMRPVYSGNIYIDNVRLVKKK